MTIFRVVRSQRVLTPDGMRPADVVIDGERIQRIASFASVPGPADDHGDLVVMPGLVDAHVHVNDPGRAQWEGFPTATRAAAAGGVTTIVDMPLNAIPPTTTPEALFEKQRAADGRCWVDVAFWGGVVPGNAAELEPLAEAGVCGFKCFLPESGVEEFPATDAHTLDVAMAALARLRVPLLIHAEAPEVLAAPGRDFIESQPAARRSYRTYLDSRPPEAETRAIERVVRLATRSGIAVHIVHLSAAEALPVIEQARAGGVSITAETCPHYLVFAAEDIPDGATEFKCAPPIRQSDNRAELWDGLSRGVIDFVASDHSPSTPDLKHQDTGDFGRAWGGIASLQLLLPAVWSEASARGHPIERVAEWICQQPAALAGLTNRKGRIAPGFDADLVVWDPDAEWEVDAERLEHRHPLTPYAGRRLRGVVHATYLRGAPVFRNGAVADQARGTMLSRT